MSSTANDSTATPQPTVDWGQLAHEFLGSMPHPLAPSVQVKDYPTAARLAAASARSSNIAPKAVEAFWQEFNSINQGLGDRAMSPEQYTQALDKIAPLSYVFHGRPPSMAEIAQMHDAPPEKVRSYYYNLPDKNYPDVPAGDMVKALQSATPFSRLYLGRDPVKSEARYLFHSGDNPQAHYQLLGGLSQPAPDSGVAAGPSMLRMPGQPYPTKETGSGGLIGRIGSAPPPLSGNGRTPVVPQPPAAQPPQSGGKDSGVAE